MLKSIIINGKKEIINLENHSLEALVNYLHLDLNICALAVNQNFVAKEAYIDTILNENDFLEILNPFPGG